ncbi:MAG: class I SAM-dependent methyltransferase [Thermodesulfobacteriota bacterium]
MRQDRQKWDRRYERHSGDFDPPDSFLVGQSHRFDRGIALDLACGTGRNALFLAESGYTVDAIDISIHALRILQAEARSRALPVRCIAADLDIFPLPRERYDLVVVFNFFDPRLFPRLRDSMRPGGLVVYSTFNTRHFSVRPEFNPAYLVEAEHLTDFFADFDILVSEPEAGEFGDVSRLVAKKPGLDASA